MTRIYYTGDMANQSGWFTTEDALTPPTNPVTLTEDDTEWGEGRKFTIHAMQVGHVYAGHCSPRFVTEAAYREYQDAAFLTYRANAVLAASERL
jgi:hypothetical protein